MLLCNIGSLFTVHHCSNLGLPLKLFLHCGHKNLLLFQASSVSIDCRGIVRLADYSIGKHLADLYKESHIQQPGVTFVDDTIPSKNSKKGDILNLVTWKI